MHEEVTFGPRHVTYPEACDLSRRVATAPKRPMGNILYVAHPSSGPLRVPWVTEGWQEAEVATKPAKQCLAHLQLFNACL